MLAFIQVTHTGFLHFEWERLSDGREVEVTIANIVQSYREYAQRTGCLDDVYARLSIFNSTPWYDSSDRRSATLFNTVGTFVLDPVLLSLKTDSEQSLDTAVRPLLDIMYQGFGQPGCPHYTPDGLYDPNPSRGQPSMRILAHVGRAVRARLDKNESPVRKHAILTGYRG